MNKWDIGSFAYLAKAEWASDYAFAPTYVPAGLAWHMSYRDGYFLGLPLPCGKVNFVQSAPDGAILARDWYRTGLRMIKIL